MPLTHDTMRFATHDVAGFSATRGFFSLPQSAIPFLFDVLGVPWCNANNEYTDTAIVRGAARNRDIITTLEAKELGPRNASPLLRGGEWVSPLREVVDLMKTVRETFDQDIQDPVMPGHESFDLLFSNGNTSVVMVERLCEVECRHSTPPTF
jgi:hypothetical protein